LRRASERPDRPAFLHSRTRFLYPTLFHPVEKVSRGRV
jgi:hypothetical protein